jgi:hypothetical protein
MVIADDEIQFWRSHSPSHAALDWFDLPDRLLKVAEGVCGRIEGWAAESCEAKI